MVAHLSYCMIVLISTFSILVQADGFHEKGKNKGYFSIYMNRYGHFRYPGYPESEFNQIVKYTLKPTIKDNAGNEFVLHCASQDRLAIESVTRTFSEVWTMNNCEKALEVFLNKKIGPTRFKIETDHTTNDRFGSAKIYEVSKSNDLNKAKNNNDRIVSSLQKLNALSTSPDNLAIIQQATIYLEAMNPHLTEEAKNLSSAELIERLTGNQYEIKKINVDESAK